MMNRLLLMVGILLFAISSQAQAEMADDFRGEGKIYVVISIILLILLGFFVLMFKLDKRTQRLQKQIDKNEG